MQARGGFSGASRLAAAALLLAMMFFFALPPKGAVAEGGITGTLGRHFVQADGKPQFVFGVNYVGHSDRSWTMWEDGRFDAALIGQDFTRAAAAGATVVRIFIRTPLHREIAAGRWEKLDSVVALAKQRALRLLITFHDYAETDLTKVSETIRVVAARYVGQDTIFGYDLQNEPHLSDLLSARYPAQAPLFTDSLIKTYGERASQVEVNAWRLTNEGRVILPSRLTDREAYYGANAYRLYRELVSAAGDWVVARNFAANALEYLASPEAARWQPMLNVLDGTLTAYLRPQLAALRAVDPVRLVTVGYSDQILAGLPANGALSFMSLHRFPNPGAKALEATIATLKALQQRFPDKPVVLEEFGFPTASRDAATVAADEAATLVYTWAENFGGAMKWSLIDVATGSNPREQSFGLFNTDGTPKPSVRTLKALTEYFKRSRPLGGAMQVVDEAGSVRFTYQAWDALIVAGRQVQDERIAFVNTIPSVVVLHWPARDNLVATASTRTSLTISPRSLLADAGARSTGSFAMQSSQPLLTVQGNRVSFPAEAGQPHTLPLVRSSLDAKTEIVWPHGGRPVTEAERANIGAYLFAGGRLDACKNPDGEVRLWRALNNGVEEQVGAGLPRASIAGTHAFTAWDFNNVDVAAARNAANKYYFRLSVDGLGGASNVWSHGADARTNFPNVDVPSQVATGMPSAVDAKVEVVWPHGDLPVDRAERVNVAAYVFQHGTTVAVPVDWDGTVRLWRSLNNGVAEEVATGQRTLKTVGKLTFPVWQFDNVDVTAAKDPLNKYYFRLTVDGVQSYSNVWSHGKDGRTYFPQMDVPTGSAVCW